MKRKRERKRQYLPHNVHRKKITNKDTKAKAREEEHLKLLSVFVVVGHYYKNIIPYNAGNSVGKITTEVYTGHILPSIANDLISRGLTLCQDADSAYTSKKTLA